MKLDPEDQAEPAETAFAIFSPVRDTHHVIPEQLPSLLRIPFRWWLSRQLRKAQSTMACPQCRQPIAAPLPLPDTLWDTLAECRQCGHAMSLLALFAQLHKSPEEQAVDAVADAEKPAGSRIEIEDTGAECIWRIPAKGGCSFMLRFAAMWLVFCGVFVTILAFSKGDDKTEGLAFIGIFVLAGLGMLYAGLRMTSASHMVRLDSTEFVFERHFLGRTTRKSWLRGSVRSVALVKFYSENYKPIHGIEVRGERGKIRFGSALEAMEKAWLCRELCTRLGLEIGPAAADVAHAVNAPVQVQDPAGRQHIRIEQTVDCCLVTVPPSRKVWSLAAIGCVFLAGGGFMLYQGLGMWMPISKGAPIPFLILFNGFIAFWCVGVAGVLPIGFSLVTLGWSLARTHQTIAANASRLVIETRCGSRTHQEIWEAAEVRDVAIEPAFEWTTNGKRTEKHRAMILLPDRVRGFGMGHPDGDLEMAAAALRAALGKTRPS